MTTYVPHLTKTSIPYADFAWPIVVGCSKDGRSGCLNCYACRLAATRLKHRPEYAGLARGYRFNDGSLCNYDWTGEVRFRHRLLDAPFHHRKPARVFVTQMGDLFHPLVTDAQIARVWSVMHITPKMTYVVLTKRHERARTWLTGCRESHGWVTYDGNEPGRLEEDTGIVVGSHKCWPLPNVHLVVSAWDQESTEAAVQDLLATPVAVRGLSIEPMLGPVELPLPYAVVHEGTSLPPGILGALANAACRATKTPMLDWVICGPETGPGKRPFESKWAALLRNQCVAAGVPYFDKRESHKEWRELPEVTS